MDFSSVYVEHDKPFELYGHYNHIEKGARNSAAPEFEFLTVSYNMKDMETKMDRYRHSLFVYIFISGDLCSIGEIMNKRPKIFYGEPFDTIKRLVFEDFNRRR